MSYLPDIVSRLAAGGNPAAGDFFIELARGRIRGARGVDVRGRCSNLTGSLVEIWEPGGAYAFPTGSARVHLSSSDAQDTALGGGARTVTVDGCGADFSRYAETVALAGTTLVQTSGTFMRVNSVSVSGSGGHGANRGEVRGWHDGATLVSYMASGSGHDAQAVYTVPAGEVGVVTSLFAHSSFDAVCRFRLMYRPGGPGNSWRPIRDFELMNADDHASVGWAFRMPPMTDIIMSAQVTRAGNVTGGPVTGGCTLLVFDASADDLEPA